MGSADGIANYCSRCGSRLDRNANYCGQCGTRHREIAPADERSRDEAADLDDPDGRDTTEERSNEDLLAFRRRVQRRLADGWDLEHDDGENVVLVDRGFGELWPHVALLLFTGGAGNLVYAWYCYSYDADRELMRAGEDERRSVGESAVDDQYRRSETTTDTTDETAATRSYVAGALLVIIAVGIIASAPLNPVAVTMGLFALGGGAWMFPPARRRLEDRHPITTFGPARSTEEEVVADPGTPCVACASPVDDGVRRTYREEYTVAGVPLATTETGTNVYCRECASGDVADVGVAPVTVSGSTDAPDTLDGRRADDDRDIETETN